jgi:hypothetical protein
VSEDLTSEDQESLETFVRDEQDHLWTELFYALDRAINGVWSINAAGIAHRIVRAARLVGPTPSGEVNWSLLAGGVYEAVLRAGGLPLDLPDEQEWQRLDDLMGKYGTRADLRIRHAAIVAAIDSDRAWISSGGE